MGFISEYVAARGGVSGLSDDEKKALIEMRKDMAKVLTTRPRLGGGTGRKNTKREKRDREQDLGKFQGMKRGHRDPKVFNDLLNPLKRYLGKQVGKRWDQVYSDIVHSVKGYDGVHRQHILDHVFGYVSVNPNDRQRDNKYEPYYVDEKGVLRMKEGKNDYNQYKERRKKEAKALARRRVDDPKNRNIQYHKLKGQWWEVTLGKDGGVPLSGDALVDSDLMGDKKPPFGFRDRHAAAMIYGREGVQGVKKRQLSARDVKKLGLPK